MAKKSAATRKSLYSVHPGVAYQQAIVDNLAARTGRSIDEWVALVAASGVAGDTERIAWLKSAHKLGGTTAHLIAERASGRRSSDTDADAYLAEAPGYVEAMYAGPKAALRPIHDALVELCTSLGDDVKVCPCQTIVPFYRAHVFAQTKPSTRARVDFGLALKGVGRELPARLLDTGGLAKGDRITHRFALSSPSEIDAEVREWARVAYELDA
jgi:hypothetical protein